MSCPSAIGARSTSIGAPAAMVEASGFIWETNGQSAATPPTAAAAPVATKRKSRRVESTEDAVVTIPNPFLAAAVGTAPGNIQRNRRRLPAPATPGRQKDHFSQPIGRNKQSRIVLLAPLPEERKPAIGCLACKALIPRRALIYSEISWATARAVTEMQIALFQPDIPQNTGTILRLCACLDVAAHIIEPAGFPVSDRHFRRAGMDYLDQVTISRHDSWPKFEQWRRA